MRFAIRDAMPLYPDADREFWMTRETSNQRLQFATRPTEISANARHLK